MRDTGPTTHTSSAPSRRLAPGVMAMPLAYVRVLPTATSHAATASVWSSTVMRNRCGRYTASVRSVAAT